MSDEKTNFNDVLVATINNWWVWATLLIIIGALNVDQIIRIIEAIKS